MARNPAILCHFRPFCKKNLYLSRQPLCFHHFARPWPLTSQRRLTRRLRSGLCWLKRDVGLGQRFVVDAVYLESEQVAEFFAEAGDIRDFRKVFGCHAAPQIGDR